MGPSQMRKGALECHLSILRNGDIECPCRLFSPMSHVEFKKFKAMSHVTIIFTPLSHVTKLMSHVEFNEMPMSPC